MSRKSKLEQLRLEKNLLVLQSDANRLLLDSDWRRLRSPETWKNEAASLARRHPLWTAALAAGAGALAVNAMRKPASVTGLIGRFGNLVPLLLAGWKMFKGKNPEA